jgi:Tfp pilus assembly PilM family ATPase
MKILALDIGTNRVKLMELESIFGRIEIKDYAALSTQSVELESVSTEQSPREDSHSTTKAAQHAQRTILSANQIAALKQMLDSRRELRPFRFDKIVVTMPRNLVTSRLLTFPTKDRKLISKSIQFELEDELPVELDDIAFDFVILQSQNNQSSVLASIVMKRDMVTLLRELEDLGIDPDIVTTESWGIGQLLARSMPNELIGAPVCVINMGASHTAFHMLVAERPVLSHIANVGGDDITRSIANSYGISFEQAEVSKTEGAFLLTREHLGANINESNGDVANITEEQKRFAKTIADAMAPLVREMRQTLMSFKSQYKMMPKALLITGGASLIPNLAAFLEDALEVPVAPLRYAGKLTNNAVQLAESTEATYAAATGLALTALKSDRGPALNLRQDEFSKKSGIASVTITAFRRPLKYAVASLVFIYANLFLQYLVLSNRAKQQQETLERSMRAVLGTVTRSSMNTYLSSPSTLRSAVGREIAKYKITQAEPEKKNISAILVLNAISKSTPRDINLDVTMLNVMGTTMEMKGLIEKESDVDVLTKALTDSKVVSGIEKGKIEQDKQSKKFRFQLNGKIEEVSDVQTQ